VLVGIPLCVTPLARGNAVPARAFRLVGLSVLSFLVFALAFGGGMQGHHFCALVPLFYALFALAIFLVFSALRARAPQYRYGGAAVLGVILLFSNASAYAGLNQRLRAGDAAGYYSPIVNGYPLLAKTEFRQYTHVFMDWGGVLTFIYLTNGQIPTYEKDDLKAVICAGNPVKLVFTDRNGLTEAQKTLAQLRLEGDVRDYAPAAHRFQYVVATLNPEVRRDCP